MKQTKETNKTNLNKTNFRNQNAITLIALVVTIVVILILAGVTISLLLDENGIIAKSKDARLENRASQVEDEIGMWKQNNFINKESDQAQEEADTILESLISRKLLKENEIDREQEIITIKKKDGSILKQISYSQVTINISKKPETEKSTVVVYTVDSVEGITMPNISMRAEKKELDDFVNALSIVQKKEILKSSMVKFVNYEDSSSNCTTFQQALEWMESKGLIEKATEEAFWMQMERDGGIDKHVKREGVDIGIMTFRNDYTGMIEGYTVTNPDGKLSNIYEATKNGTYTFKIQDNITGKIYTKKIDVTNVEGNDKYYVTNIRQSDIERNTAKLITKLASTKEIKLGGMMVYSWCIGLRDTQTKSLQTFTTAYIIYNNQKIDISSVIDEANGYSYVRGWNIGDCLSNQIENFDRDEFEKSEYQFIIEKDGIEYKGFGKVCEE